MMLAHLRSRRGNVAKPDIFSHQFGPLQTLLVRQTDHVDILLHVERHAVARTRLDGSTAR